MSAKSKAGLGIHIGVAGVRASLATGGQIAHLPLPESAGTVLSWLRISGGRLACVTAPELLGVEGAENAALHSLQAVFRALKQAIDPQVREQLQVAIAVPRILPEPQRRRLLFTAQECFGQARLIDSTTAALHASPALQAEGSGPSIAVVAEDPALEMCISAPEGEDNKILGYRSIREFSGHALHHHLLQLTIDRLPANMQKRLSEADDETLSRVLMTVLRIRPILARLSSIVCPLSDLDSPPPNVGFAANDITSWMEARLGAVEEAFHGLAKEVPVPIGRALLVGAWGQWPPFLSWFENKFGSPLVYDLECLADGAALAAAAAPAQQEPIKEPSLRTSMSDLLSGLTGSVQFPSAPPAGEKSSEEKLQEFFDDVAVLVAARKHARAQELLVQAKQKAEAILAALNGETVLRPPAPPPLPKAAAEMYSTESFVETQFPLIQLPYSARRLFEEAERLMESGRILEAVGSSHLAHQSAPASHEALMRMLDLHRRAAKLLAASGEFDVAEAQLRCALSHRQGDEDIRRDLGQLLLKRAALQEQQNPEEAVRLYEDALDCVEDDAVAGIVQTLERLERLRGTRG